jgi:hypothetical protein
MDRRLVVGLLAVFLCPVGVTAAPAFDQTSPPTLEELLERIETLEQDKGRMRGEIDTLRAQVGQDWLTEQRADEIKGIVADVLADADTRASLASDGLTAGWDGNFFLASGDGRFRLNIAGLMQFRYVWNFHDQADRYISGFENTRTDLFLSGHVFGPDLTYMIRSAWGRAGGFDQLLDAYIEYQLDNNWSTRFGQWRIPFNREELVESRYQLLVERSLVNESHNIGRSQGVGLTWQNATNKVDFMLNDAPGDNVGGGGFVGTNGQNTPALVRDTEFSLAARWEHLFAGSWEQFKDFTSPPGEPFAMMFGLGGHWMIGEFGDPFRLSRDEDRWVGVAADVSVEWGGANLFAGVTYHYIDDIFSGQIPACSMFRPSTSRTCTC